MRRDWKIQCPARCIDRGCQDHPSGTTWRTSKHLYGMSPLRAILTLRKHRADYPKSGPYRLRRL